MDYIVDYKVPEEVVIIDKKTVYNKKEYKTEDFTKYKFIKWQNCVKDYTKHKFTKLKDFVEDFTLHRFPNLMINHHSPNSIQIDNKSIENFHKYLFNKFTYFINNEPNFYIYKYDSSMKNYVNNIIALSFNKDINTIINDIKDWCLYLNENNIDFQIQSNVSKTIIIINDLYFIIPYANFTSYYHFFNKFVPDIWNRILFDHNSNLIVSTQLTYQLEHYLFITETNYKSYNCLYHPDNIIIRNYSDNVVDDTVDDSNVDINKEDKFFSYELDLESEDESMDRDEVLMTEYMTIKEGEILESIHNI